MHEAIVFSQPLDLLVVIILHHCFQTAVISGSDLKVGVVSQKKFVTKKEPPPFKILDPPLQPFDRDTRLSSSLVSYSAVCKDIIGTVFQYKREL